MAYTRTSPYKSGYTQFKHFSDKKLALKEAKNLRKSGKWRAQVTRTFSPWRSKWTVWRKRVE